MLISISIPRSFGTRKQSDEYACQLLGETDFLLFITTECVEKHVLSESFQTTVNIPVFIWQQSQVQIRELFQRVLADDSFAGPLTVSVYPDDGAGLTAAITADTIDRLSAFDEFSERHCG